MRATDTTAHTESMAEQCFTSSVVAERIISSGEPDVNCREAPGRPVLTTQAVCRAGDKSWYLEMLYAKGSMLKLAPSAREAAKALIMDPNLGEFHNVPGWTYLSQLHGPKARLLKIQCYY